MIPHSLKDLEESERDAKSGDNGLEGVRPGVAGAKHRSDKVGLADAAQAPAAASQLGKGFIKEGALAPAGTAAGRLTASAVQFFWGNGKRRRNSLLGGAGGVIAVSLIFASVSFLPNELISIMSDMENVFFAHVENMISHETQVVLSDYIKHRIIDRLNGVCKNSAELDQCIKVTPATSTDPVDKLYDTWDENNLPGELADQGIVFEKDAGGAVRMTATVGESTKTVDLTKFMAGEANLFDDPALDAEVQQALTDAVNKVIEPDNSYLHVIYTRAMSIYGLFKLDNPSNNADEEQADTAYTEERDVTETADAVSAGVDCLVQSCDPAARSTTNNPDMTDAPVPESQFEGQLTSQLAADAAADGTTDLATLEKTAASDASNGEAGFVDKIIAKLLNVAGADVSAETVSKFTGPIGWITLAASFINFISHSGPELTAIAYTVKVTAAIAESNKDVAAADEQKASLNGQAGANAPSLAALGSVATDVGNGVSSPAYSYYVNSANTTQTASSVHSYLYQNHLTLNDYSNVITQISSGFNSIPGIGLIVALAGLVQFINNHTIGWLSNFLVSHTPGVSNLTQAIASVATPLLKDLIFALIPLPNMTNMSPQTHVNLSLIGMDVSGQKAAQYAGGEVLTPAQSAAITTAQENQDRAGFTQRPLFARLFDPQTPYSFVSRLATMLPVHPSLTVASSALSDLLQNPVGKVMGTFSSIFADTTAIAAQPPQPDPAGVTQYGVPSTDPVFNTPPKTYWQQHNCAQEQAQGWPTWNSTANTRLNPATQQLENNTVNGCLVIYRTLSADGALFGYTGG